ncbi:MAG TPA: TlpA family protein disulfide reductase [bacterium]|nr:TlpA family protein disulfide reductase [bacterium]
MNSRLLIITLVLSSALAGCTPQVEPDDRGYIVAVGDRVDDFEIRLLDGRVKKLSEFNAPVLMLNFFASWCVVCRKEIPHIENEVWQPLKDSGVMVIGVNYKETADIAATAQEQLSMTYPVALDEDGKIFEKFARGGVTRNIILDRDLKIIFLTRLFDPDEFAQMKRVIKKQLAQSDQNVESKGMEMEKKYLKDVADSQKKITLEYQGSHKVHLEGKIISAAANELEIGVTMFEEDIVSRDYDAASKTFRIGYRHFTGVRIAILPLTKLRIPSATETVLVFDVD